MEKLKKLSSGRLLHEGVINGEEFVVIATKNSTNEKTGNMTQIWILLKNTHPVAAVASGLDSTTICGDCPFSGGKGCYVVVTYAPAGIWKAYQRKSYSWLHPRDYHSYFGGEKVRFGAYGNPTLLPFSVAKAIAKASDGWTGYFHNWHTMTPAVARQWNTLFMASTETTSSLELARSLKLRVFHANPVKPADTVECVSETHGITCKACMLCSGTNKKAKSVWINPHGSRVKRAMKAIE